MPASNTIAFHHLSVALLLAIAICARANASFSASASHSSESRSEAGDQDDEEAIIRGMLEWAKSKGMSDVLKTSPVKVRAVLRCFCLLASF